MYIPAMLVRCVQTLLCVLAFAVLPAPAAPPTTRQAETLGAKIVAFCVKHKGKQVADGECAMLASEALKAAGAKRRGPDAPDKEDYVWGKLVYTHEAGQKPVGRPADVKPGAVVQFRDATFRWKVPGGTYTETFPHHTAIVTAVEDKGATIKYLHQNHNGDRTVQDGALRLADLQAGWLRFYEPLPAK